MILANLSDVAHFFGVSTRTISRMRERGELPAPTRRTGLSRVCGSWDSNDLIELKEKIDDRKKFRPECASHAKKVSSLVDTKEK